MGRHGNSKRWMCAAAHEPMLACASHPKASSMLTWLAGAFGGIAEIGEAKPWACKHSVTLPCDGRQISNPFPILFSLPTKPSCDCKLSIFLADLRAPGPHAHSTQTHLQVAPVVQLGHVLQLSQGASLLERCFARRGGGGGQCQGDALMKLQAGSMKACGNYRSCSLC